VLKKPVVIEEFGLTWFKKTPAQQRVLFQVKLHCGEQGSKGVEVQPPASGCHCLGHTWSDGLAGTWCPATTD